MKTRTTSARIGLVLREERTHEFFNLKAWPVWIGPSPSELAWLRDGRSPELRQIADDRISNPNDYTESIVKGGVFLHDLIVEAQAHIATDGTRTALYGFTVGYKDVRIQNASEAKRLYTSLTVIEKRLAKMYDLEGQAADFGQYVGRVARAIGATQIVIPAKANHRNTSMYADTAHNFRKLAEGIYHVNALAAQWIAEGQPKVEAAS